MSEIIEEEITEKTHFFCRDSNDPTRIYAIPRKQHAGDPAQPPAPVVSVVPDARMANYYQKAFLKPPQTENSKQPTGSKGVRRARKKLTGRRENIPQDDTVYPDAQNEPGIPAANEDSEEEGTTRTRKRKIPCELDTYYKLQALHEKNPFQYAELSEERREGWKDAVRLGNGTSNPTIKVDDREVTTLKALLIRHLKKYKEIDKQDFGTGEEREEQYEQYMKLMRDLEECRDNGVVAERNPKKAKKDAAVAKRLRAVRFGMESGISISQMDQALNEDDGIDRYDDDLANADLSERCEEIHFDRDEMIQVNEDGIMESFSPFPESARLPGLVDSAAEPRERIPAEAADKSSLDSAETAGTSSVTKDKSAATNKLAGKPATKKCTPKKSPFKGISGIRGAAEAMRKTAALKRNRGQLANLTDSLQVAVAQMNSGDAKERSSEQSESFWNRITEKEKDKADREERMQRDANDRAERDRVRALQVEKEEKDRLERAEEMEEKKQERKERYDLMKLELEVRAKEAENKGNDSKLIMELLGTIVKNQCSSNKTG